MIKVQSLSKKFSGRNAEPVVALREIDFEIKPGEFTMVTGPSGSGKSTLLFTIGGMLKPTDGEVILGETNIYRLSPSERSALRRTQIGFVFQTFNLIPYLNCLENVALPARLAGKSFRSSMRRARDMLGHLGLAGRLDHRPSELSVGERQRVAICRSLVNDPEVILADEPTGNLDSKMTDEVMHILLELNTSGQTIIMATHNPQLTEQGTRVIALHEGCIRDNKLSSIQELAK